MNTSKESPLFDSHTLRRIVGIMAFALPLVTRSISSGPLTSISASYHTEARDIFVGALAVIGAVLMAYQGHTPVLPPGEVGSFWRWVGGFLNWISNPWRGEKDFRVLGRKREEDIVSTIGGVAAIVTIFQPTACDTCVQDQVSRNHAIAACVLFSTVVYFCLFAFLRRVNEKLKVKSGFLSFLRGIKENVQGKGVMETLKRNGFKISRGIAYLICGFGIAFTLLTLIATQLSISEAASKELALTFKAEEISLYLFGVAWSVASQPRFLADEDEKESATQQGQASYPQAEAA